jgi:hypothetical protein
MTSIEASIIITVKVANISESYECKISVGLHYILDSV